MKDDFLFSKELRERMAKFGDMDVGEAIQSPAFFEALLDHAGMDQKQKNDLWEKVGRPDLKK
jgi:hypothetical protein